MPESIKSSWQMSVVKYQSPDVRRSLWQVINSLVPYFGLLYLMYLSLTVSYWMTLGLSFLTAGFYVRIFIVFHDCGHGSFFTSQKANDILGILTGVLTFTPYFQWRHEHAMHHASSGDLDRRGIGDIWTMTVQEYLGASRWKRLVYRVYRTPFVMFVVGPLYLFLIRHRLVRGEAASRERRSVYGTNLAVFALMGVMTATIGMKAYLLVQLPVLLIGGGAGVWLFYVQHQFEGVYWARHEDWDYVDAALEGSSLYQLPKVLQWFTGNIGFHHIHHLSPRIPNYYLEKCQKENPAFQQVRQISLLSSLKSLAFRLWDEEQRRLVGYRGLARARRYASSEKSLFQLGET
ncbi:MAG: fatty acid desaturase [Armatimonadetes bacterium CG2_30_59_28]|nr:fatty acid desaturase [Armatimonadota bacterium]OIO97955.1 MAG: fatty acid desaturase [Armatimonadetes bacterium CG2_30_59_28]PIU63543.1 MAG: fatty acid desaturase [Armatimonadetes bacterium CG07_land_8_20_14_0_80_59_28]PIX40553.1 MAG: fatty acid desaturase [Armatimonadetes bacterium CG_4_8_14_3_um_filter_58_9]PJB70581.1 MAG: fatty acid desaturase [Armatimonadetes bacterium CG_4_9_14_3_um_filter_58_7]